MTQSVQVTERCREPAFVDAHPEFSTARMVLGEPARKILVALEREGIGLRNGHHPKLDKADPAEKRHSISRCRQMTEGGVSHMNKRRLWRSA